MDRNTIEKLLPQFNCGACGYKNCNSFCKALINNKVTPTNCPVLLQERFKKNRIKLNKYISQYINHDSKNNTKTKLKFTGLIDHAAADFILHPLKGEPSCRETLVNFTAIPLSKNMTIKYRPLGCPITHFAKILNTNHGLLDVWVIGPPRTFPSNQITPPNPQDNPSPELQDNYSNSPSPELQDNYSTELQSKIIDLGICMVLSFQGTVETKLGEELPEIGETVQFLPAHCMMGKVHSGVIVSMEENKCRIDCIDLKVQTPRKFFTTD